MNETIIKEGKIYWVNHQRRGRFAMYIESADQDWVKGTVVKGKADAILPYNVVKVGEEISVRREFCTFELSERKS